MKSRLILRLAVEETHLRSLERLQDVFAQACNVLAGIVAETRCWNRVALHHLAYRRLREEFPGLGSQMVCNAIYSVCRMARLVYQGSDSPWCIQKRPNKPLPRLAFAVGAPVYFDRHTLSVRNGALSMYSLDGRLHFQGVLQASEQRRFLQDKLKEVLLSRDADGFFLIFSFGQDSALSSESHELPQYVLILQPAVAAA